MKLKVAHSPQELLGVVSLTMAPIIERSRHSRCECFCIGKNSDKNLTSIKKIIAVFH